VNPALPEKRRSGGKERKNGVKIKIQDNKNCQKLIKIEVEKEKVQTVLEEVYKEIGQSAQVPGFRKGKAPRDMLELHYSETAREEALRHLIWESYREAVKENKIDPINYPAIEDVKFGEDNHLSFTAKVDIVPTINLKPYTNIKIKKETDRVTEQDVSKALDSIRESLAKFETIESAPVKMGDYAVCDYECTVEGKVIDTQKGVWLEVKEDSNLPEIAKALIGCNKSQVKEVSFALPKNYKVAAYAGKNAAYKIALNEIKQKVLPAQDDAFAKQAGKFENLQQLKDELTKEIGSSKKQQQQANMEGQLFDSLLKANQFDVPESVVDRQLQSMISDAKLRLMYQGYKKEDIEAQEGKLKESLAINAKEHVRLFFILEQIAKKENLRTTDEELDKHIEKISINTNQDKAKVRKTLEEKDLIENLKEQLLHDKVTKFLLEKSNITEEN